MQLLKVLSALVGLIVVVLGLVGLFRSRREQVSLTLEDVTPAPWLPLPPFLADAGFTEAIVAGGLRGGRGTFDGVVVQALGQLERAPRSSMIVWTFAVPAPPGARRWNVSARSQGVRRRRGSLVLGLPDVDTRVDVTGDAADARELFGRLGAGALIEAITVHGWQLVGGRLARPVLTTHDPRSVALAGAAAAKVFEDRP